MVSEARKYFLDRGITLTSGYGEKKGTDLNSGIAELEGHRVFIFKSENFDIVDNNVWFYYSPKIKVGYKYENGTWSKV